MQIRPLKNSLILLVAEGFYSGKSPIASGTAGTVVGVFLYYFFSSLTAVWYLIVCIVIAVIGLWLAGEAEKLLGKKDAPSIVIDEITGYLVSMTLIPVSWGYMAAGFILFRFFDIVKPWPLQRIQNLHGGVGVMLDDIGAAVYTNIILQISYSYYKSISL